MLGAIIITTDQSRSTPGDISIAGAGSERAPWASVEVLGKAPVTRLAEAFKEVCEFVSVIAIPPQGQTEAQAKGSISDLADECFASYKRRGCEAVFIARCGAYVELDIADMLAFHQEQGLEGTRAFA